MEDKKIELPSLEYYNVPFVLNEFSYHGDKFNVLFDMLSCVDSQYNREGNSFHEIFENFRWHPIDSFRLQCLDIACDVIVHHERLEKYVHFFVERYLCILKAEKGEAYPTFDDISKFYKDFVEAYFRGMGCYESSVSLESHNIYCFSYLLQHLVENIFTSRRSLLNFDLIAETERVTRDALNMMLNSHSHNALFKLVSQIPMELRKPEILAKIRLLADAGFLNHLGMPSSHVTTAELAVIAECICRTFNIKGKDGNGNVNWSLFETFWGKKNLRQASYKQGGVNPAKHNPNITEIVKIINN